MKEPSMPDGGERTGTAFVFPGMGPAAAAELGRYLLLDPYARELAAEADERLGYSLIDRLQADPGDYTQYAQTAFFVCCVALAGWARRETGLVPDYCVGPSFGIKPLTAFTGCLAFADAVELTAGLARCLDGYFAAEHLGVVTHSFARTPAASLVEILAGLHDDGIWHEVSCHVDDDLHMVTLAERDLERLEREVRAVGGMSLYTMRPPMHASVFAPLRARAEAEVLAALPAFADPEIPVVSDYDGALLTTGTGARDLLLDGIVRPMRWPAAVETLMREGVGTVCVCGPDALFGRVAKTTENFHVVAANPRLALRPRRAQPRATAPDSVDQSTSGVAKLRSESSSSASRAPYAFSSTESSSTDASESRP
jgi:[acyl-carrier-protein] S-malonyltransferase